MPCIHKILQGQQVFNELCLLSFRLNFFSSKKVKRIYVIGYFLSLTFANYINYG